MDVQVRVHEDFDLGGGFALTQGIHNVSREVLFNYLPEIQSGNMFFPLEINQFDALNQQLNEQIYLLYKSDSDIKNSIPAVPLTTKGDLLGYSTQNVRVPVGADNTILTGDSTAARGIAWKSLIASQIPNLDAAKITTGVLNHARLGTGGGGSTKFLREDNTFQTISTGLTVGTTPISGGTNNRVLFQSSAVVSQSGGLTFNGNTFESVTSSNSAPALRVKGAASQANNANYFDIRRSDDNVIFSVKEDSVGGVINIHGSNGSIAGFYRVNAGGVASGLDLGAYGFLNIINQQSNTDPVGLKAIGSAGGAIDFQYRTWNSNVFFSGYTGAGANGGEVVINDLQSSLEIFHSYSSNNSNMGVRFPNGKVGIGSSGVPDEKLHLNGNFKMSDASNIILGTSVGTSLGSAFNQKTGMHGEAIAQDTGWSVSGYTALRTVDASTVSHADLAKAFCTLIEYLTNKGLLGT